MRSRFLAVSTALIVLAASFTLITLTSQPVSAQQECHPAYIGGCVPTDMGDVNCGDLNFAVRLRNVNVDPYNLDSDDDDDIGCESNGPAPARQPASQTPVAKARRPVGKVFKITQVGKTKFVQATGWALDPDVRRPSRVRIFVDGKARKTVKAKGQLAKAPARFQAHGKNHRFAVKVAVGKGKHRVCVVALNEGRKAKNRSLGCKVITR